jgi:hypothetical protein
MVPEVEASFEADAHAGSCFHHHADLTGRIAERLLAQDVDARLHCGEADWSQ